jgi:hypothetical protein
MYKYLLSNFQIKYAYFTTQIFRINKHYA